ncbi:MAG: hypothetical protein BAA04_13560 [Firmicutes bacterium ZCTH02-B6]|nr:MAG: hypothetical protein BAA04_13560 [Firmicutes bacterium ZCTH02-B6]
MWEFLSTFLDVVLEVAVAIAPLAAVGLILNLKFLRLPRNQARSIATGLVLTAAGTVLFLYGVRIGFMPAGQSIGRLVAASRPWMLVPIGFILGLVTILAEPTVRVQTQEVARVSGGTIPERLLLIALAVGVGAAVALAMLRVWLDLPLLAVLIPGYALAFALMFLVSPGFTSIAFDSGGVATGPITVTFIAAVALGAAQGIPGADPVVAGFGLVALVGLAPVLAVLVLGVLFRRAHPASQAAQKEREEQWRTDRSS